MSNAFVTVIIPTYNDWKRLGVCLDALRRQSYPAESFEVLVVNNNPDDEVPVTLDIPSNTSILREPRPGSYAARNAALRAAKGNIIAFTDSDCIPDTDWIRNAVSHFEKHPGCSRIGGEVVLFPKNGKTSVAEKYDQLFFFQQESHVKNLGSAVTANLFVYRSVFEAVGYFDEGKMSNGDIDWGMKSNKAGYRIDYLRNVIVKHPARSLRELIKKEKRLIGGRQYSSGKKNFIHIIVRFLKDVRPRLGEFRFVKSRGTGLSVSEVLSITCVRYLLQYVRCVENMKLQLGKRPNRE